MRVLRALLAASAVALTLPASAQPSFDCGKATTGVERAICGDADISRVDREMAAAFASLNRRLDGPADFRRVNAVFASLAKRGSDQAVPAAVDGDRETGWSYEQGFNLHRPSAHTISVEISYYAFTGGAHGNGGNAAMLVGLRSGSVVQLASVFAGGETWRRTIMALVIADLARQFVERPGFEESLRPDNMAKLLAEPDRYLFTEDLLRIIYNAYDVGSYAAGAYVADVPYSGIRGLIRPDGPLGR